MYVGDISVGGLALPPESVLADKWGSKYPDRVPKRRSLRTNGGFEWNTITWSVPVSDSGAGTADGTLFPLRFLHYQAVSGPLVAPAGLTADVTWEAPTLRDYFPRKPRILSSAFWIDRWTAPIPVVAPELVVTQGQHRIARFRPRSTAWGQQHFVVEIDIPVMSWTGLYLDPVMHRKVRRNPEAAGLIFVPFVSTLLPSGWGPLFSLLNNRLVR